MRDLSLPEIAALAREMVMAIKPPDALREKLGVSVEDFEEIQQSTVYQNLYKTYAIEWESATSTTKRLALQAAAALETILPDVVNRINNEKEALPGVIQGVTVLAKLAGADAAHATGGGGSGERFKITINLGPEKTLPDTAGMVTIEGGSNPVLAAPLPESEGGPDLSGFPEG